MGIRKETQIKYWAIYEDYLKYRSFREIMLQHDCDRTTAWRAIKDCREQGQRDLSTPEAIQDAIEVKRYRIRNMHDRLAFLEGGWEEESVTEKDGIFYHRRVKGKFSPVAETGFYKEIRELEDDIEELQGLHEHKLRDTTEDTGEDLDTDAIRQALDESGVEGEEE